MPQTVITLDADQKRAAEFCELLAKKRFAAIAVSSFHGLEESIEKDPCLAVFIDVDTVPVSNHQIRDLSLRHPGTHLFCLSERRFHPELRDAICYHVYACINKPVDSNELFFWLRSISEDYKDEACAENDKNL